MAHFHIDRRIHELTRFDGAADLTNGLYSELQFGHGKFFQLSADRFALTSMVRPGNQLGGADYTAGSVLTTLGDIDELPSGTWQVVQQNEVIGDHSAGGALLNMTGGLWVWFVPAGARLATGEPHPHAGTGFALGHIIQVPLMENLLWDYQDLLHKSTRWMRSYPLSYHAGALEVGEPVDIAKGELYVVPSAPITLQMEAVLKDKPGYLDWRFCTHGLGPAIADGDAMLMPAMATPHRLIGDTGIAEFACESAGVMRWTCQRGTWRPVSFVPIAITVGPGQQFWHEPSIIRLTDGGLLFSARGRMGPYENTIRVWHSPDALHWHTVMDMPKARAESPIVLNQAADGTPYFAYNPYREEDSNKHYGAGRRRLAVSPLLQQGKKLAAPEIICEAPLEADGRCQWYLDHPLGATVRGADRQWRHFLNYRSFYNKKGNFNPAEHELKYGASICEIKTSGPAFEPWRFELGLQESRKMMAS